MSDLRTPEVEDLLRVFAALDDEDVIFSLLEDLFTIREIKETSQRLAVARQLDAGKSYSAIEEATGASATTIARVSKCLSYGAGGYNAALNALDERREEAPLAHRFAARRAPLRLHTGRRAPLVSYANGVSCSASRSRAARASTRSSSSCWVCTPSLW